MTETEYDLFTRKDYYRGVINYEGILSTHINRIASFRDQSPKKYISSIETFILMCPITIRNKGLKRLSELGLIRGRYNEKTGEDHMIMYDDLWIYVNELLEKDNLIFKTGSFEIGHD